MKAKYGFYIQRRRKQLRTLQLLLISRLDINTKIRGLTEDMKNTDKILLYVGDEK
jgi:hypothetical protein